MSIKLCTGNFQKMSLYLTPLIQSKSEILFRRNHTLERLALLTQADPNPFIGRALTTMPEAATN